MGFVQHTAIVVTHWNKENVLGAKAKAMKLGLITTEVTESEVNGYTSFMVAPDGSKLGWPNRVQADEARQKFCDWMDEGRDPYISERYVDYVMVNFGGDLDHYEACVERTGVDENSDE